MSHKKNISRRRALKLATQVPLMGIGASHAISLKKSYAQTSDPMFLFVVSAAGGAAIIDSFLPQSSGPAAYDQNQIARPQGSNLSCVTPMKNSIQGAINLGNGYSLETFLKSHGQDLAVLTTEVSSVNHQVAAHRSLTGDNVNKGRTILEEMALKYGQGRPLPNLTMSSDGYAMPGSDTTIPAGVQGAKITDPLMFAFATHGFKGLNSGFSHKEMKLARTLRSELESVSVFGQKHAAEEQLKIYLENRHNLTESIEKGDYITSMMLSSDASLGKFDLKVTDSMRQIQASFPDLFKDPLEAQMALAFLAAKNGLSVAANVMPGGSPLITAQGTPNTPIAFDWSHVDHRGAQNSMWSYILKSTSALIELLKKTDVDGNPAKGKMWDRSLVYIATEFGRDKIKSGGSGHHLNNGSVLISPLIKGNRVFGGVDSASGLTYGFHPKTGKKTPGQHLREKHIYSAIAQALDLKFEGRVDMSAVIRKA